MHSPLRSNCPSHEAFRVLFVLKKRHLYGSYSAGGLSSGLYNSSSFVVDMLQSELGIKAQLVVVDDNNQIDKEVTVFRPDVVVIEALWVVPEKFAILHRLHPKVKWIVRIHSSVPFLAHEGNAISWLLSYPQYANVFIACNDDRARRDMETLLKSNRSPAKVLFLPNWYPPIFYPRGIKPCN